MRVPRLLGGYAKSHSPPALEGDSQACRTIPSWIDTGLAIQGLSEQFQRERNDRIAQFTEDRKERRQYNEGVRNVIEAQTEAVRTLTAKVNQVLPVVSDMPPRSMS